MRSRKRHTISAVQVQLGARVVCDSLKLPDHGWKCPAAVVSKLVLRAAARLGSLAATCRDPSRAPTDDAVLTALGDGLRQRRGKRQ